MPDRSDLAPRLGGFAVDQRPTIAALAEAVRYNHKARRFWLDAPSGSSTGTLGGWSGAVGDRPYRSLADAAIQGSGWWIQLPYDSFGRPIRVRIYWTQDGTAAGNFFCDLAIQIRKAGDVLTAASGWIFENLTLAAPGIANSLVITTVNPAPTVTAPVIDEDTMVSVRFRRLGTNAADTCTDAMRLAGLEISCL